MLQGMTPILNKLTAVHIRPGVGTKILPQLGTDRFVSSGVANREITQILKFKKIKSHKKKFLCSRKVDTIQVTLKLLMFG